MKVLEDFLKRYKNIKAPNRTKQKVFIDAVYKYIDIKLDNDDFKINRDTISLKTESIIRSEIKLHEKVILNYINEHLGEDFVSIY